MLLDSKFCFVDRPDQYIGDEIPDHRALGQRWSTVCITRAAPRRLDSGHISLFHRHHRFEDKFCLSASGPKGVGQRPVGDLPG